MWNIRPKLLFWHLSLFHCVLHSFIRNFPLFCHNVEWNKQPPQAFFIALYFSHYLHPFRELPCWFSLIPLFTSQTPSYPHRPSWLWFSNSPACVVCLCVHSSLPPLSESVLLAVYGLSVTEATTRERREKEMRGGRQCLSWVCGVRGTLRCLFSVLYDVACWMRDWFIVLFSCCPGRSRCWLNRAGENICTTKAICVYYGLFHYVYGSVSAIFCSDNLLTEQIAYLNFVWIAFIAICTIFKLDAIFFAIYIWCTACTSIYTWSK